ncbi:tyrosine-type recombinase/integrase [Deinococcus xinjiangensis]
MYVREIGKRVSVTEATEAKARKALQTLVSEIQRGEALARRTEHTFGAYAEHVISTRTLSDRTRDLYRSQVRLYCRPLRDVKLDQITPDMLSKLYSDIQKGVIWDERGRKQAGTKPRKVRVAQIVHVVVRLVLKTALDREIIAKNPADVSGVRPADTKGGEVGHVKAWTPEQAARILKAAGQVTNGPIIAFLLLTGMRRGEALALKWEAVNLRDGFVTVKATRSPSDGTIREDKPKTGRSRRDVPLTEESAAVLSILNKSCTQSEKTMRARHVFRNTVDKPLAPLAVNVTLTRCLDLLDAEKDENGDPVEPMPRLPVHSLRHTFVSIMAAQGHPLHVIADWIGDRPETVSRVYLHVFKGRHVMPSLGIGNFQGKS